MHAYKDVSEMGLLSTGIHVLPAHIKTDYSLNLLLSATGLRERWGPVTVFISLIT